ncbi:MAG: phosphonate ABC transporter ATP-binding protein, partial [Desulfobacterales bacterium]|nr:phosphonate ABC transporter ATP-binding protein [Desulfobacterales bacterium]
DGVALVASLHQVENIRYFDRVLGLKDGELAFDTGPEEAGKLFERVYGGVK